MLRLHGTQITLRDWQLKDLPEYHAWNQPGHGWQELDGPYYPRATEADLLAKTDQLTPLILADGFSDPRNSLVIADAVTDHLLGQVTWYWQGIETNWVSIGIVIFDSQAWGKGIGHEALGLWMDYLFAVMPTIVRLDLRTWSGNIGMMRLAEKLGFQLEAQFRKARIVRGLYYDGMGYGILREEWEHRR
jgi:RimJ/RimL family protein N-acetyltransferase